MALIFARDFGPLGLRFYAEDEHGQGVWVSAPALAFDMTPLEPEDRAFFQDALGGQLVDTD